MDHLILIIMLVFFLAVFIDVVKTAIGTIREDIPFLFKPTHKKVKNIAKLKIPILVLPEMYVIKPTTRGPNNAANFPSMLYIPKYSQSLSFGIKVE